MRGPIESRLKLSGNTPAELTRKFARLYLAEDFRAKLEPYAGMYRNDDLEVTANIVVRDGSLHFERPGVPDGRLVFTGKDSFRVYRNWDLEFVRDASGISGFTVNMGRAKGVWFARAAPDAARTQ